MAVHEFNRDEWTLVDDLQAAADSMPVRPLSVDGGTCETLTWTMRWDEV